MVLAQSERRGHATRVDNAGRSVAAPFATGSEFAGRGGIFIALFHPSKETSSIFIILKVALIRAPAHSRARLQPHCLRRTPC
jgi:hypothetical protein